VAAVNYERAWLELKAELAKKSSHSARELFDAMGRIEVDNMLTPEQELFDGSPLHVRHATPSDEPAEAQVA
jgi:hypothetical protein